MNKRKGMSRKFRFEILKRDNFTCQYCGRGAPQVVLEIDHIKPVILGGRNGRGNLLTACKDCNAGKGPRPLNQTFVWGEEEAALARATLAELDRRRAARTAVEVE